MPDIVNFTAATPRFAFPMLHFGQAQKEIFVNEALSLTDTLLHCMIESERTSPPQNPNVGQVWLIGTNATGIWSENEGDLACWHNGGWRFTAPCDGIRVLNRATSQEMLFLGTWRKASVVVEPLGGSSVDPEARAAIHDLISALQTLGILPST